MALINGRKRDFHNPERRFILPRTFVLRPGLTMLLGRLGRLDVIAVGLWTKIRQRIRGVSDQFIHV